MLLRVGRHSGAESVTLERHRSIRIRTGGHRQDYWAREATTIWLAAEHEDDITGLRPFGWLLIEPANNPPGEDLKRWCERETIAFTKSAPSEGAAAKPGAPAGEAPGETWERAQLQYNARNGTLTAIGPNNTRANAFDEQAQELLSRLPQEVQRRVRANQFVRARARVQGSKLIAVAVEP